MFLQFASNNGKNSKNMYCSCHGCGYMSFGKIEKVRDHIYFNGVDQSYTHLIFNGKTIYIASLMSINKDKSKTYDVFDGFD